MQRLIIFDFDGTLADSEELMLSSLNALAEEFAFAPIAAEEFTRLREFSMREFITKRLRIPLWRVFTLLRLEKDSKEEYAKRSAGLKLFSGMSDVLRTLRQKGFAVGVVSSAPTVVVERVLQESDAMPDIVRAGVSTFGKSRAIRRMLRERRLPKDAALYVGDELRDLDACRSAGISMLSVSWGLNSPERLRAAGLKVASTPEELLSMLTA